jgi:acyl-CoA reductase-like NAD-dependent aldehyde dehydrogenase
VELGGKGAVVVLEDADLALAAQASVMGGFLHGGQICFTTERVLVHAAVLDQFLPLLRQVAQNWVPHGAIGKAGPERTLRLVQDALDKGAELVYGEAKMLGVTETHPIILKGVTSEMEISDEESFGPVLCLYVINSDQEAVDLVNSSRYGLSAGVYSKDVYRAISLARQLEVGQTQINTPMPTGREERKLSSPSDHRSNFLSANSIPCSYHSGWIDEAEWIRASKWESWSRSVPRD